MKKQIISICIITLISIVYALDKQALTRETVNEHWVDISFWEHGISSKLIEPGYNYAWESIRDKNLTTAWVEGSSGDGIGEWVIIPIKGTYQYLDYEDDISDKQLLIKLQINNGFCKNERTFNNNNRVKKAKITIYEVPLIAYEDYRGTQALDEPSIMHETEILIEDTMNQQSFSFNCSPKASFLEGSLYLYVQLTILDVYPGKKYQDTCISELKATAEVIEKTTTATKKNKISGKLNETPKHVKKDTESDSKQQQENIRLVQVSNKYEKEIGFYNQCEKELFSSISQTEINERIKNDYYSKIFITKNDNYYWFFEIYKAKPRLCCKSLNEELSESPYLRGNFKENYKDPMNKKMYSYVEKEEYYRNQVGPSPSELWDLIKDKEPLWAVEVGLDCCALENLECVQNEKILYSFTSADIKKIQRAFILGNKVGGYR